MRRSCPKKNFLLRWNVRIFTGMPRTIKQYFRWPLVKLGMFDEKAFRLAIDEIRKDDTFIVSYPKSGNTWLRFLIASLISEEEVTFQNIDSIVPDIYSATEKVNTLPSPRFIKAHHTYFDIFPKCIYIVRDVRDVLVSYFHYHTALGDFKGTFSGYISEVDTLHPFGEWQEHITKAFRFASAHPDKIHIVKYEAMQQDPIKIVNEIIRFCGIQPKCSPEEAVRKNSFEKLKEAENTSGSQFMDLSGKHFFREGKTGEWKNFISEKDLELIMRKNKEAMLLAGYTI